MLDEKITKEGLAYGDVLLIPQRSSILSRKLVDVSSNLTKDIRLKMPILSANMDTVTEHKTAIAMARMGGLGVIHRFMSIDDQVEQVKKVKRFESYRVDAPYTLEPGKTLGEARESMRKFGVTGLLIVDHLGRLEGILTRRDVAFENDN
ncbi:MAG: IMP dehydrogenase, partial [Candidatus Paceibacterota bacterium]